MLNHLSLVSQSFNAAAIPVLYSWITVSGPRAVRLASTSQSNPSLLSYTHSLCFTKPGPVPWDVTAQILCASPNLRRFLWLHDEVGPMKISMLHNHYNHLTEIAFPDKPLLSLAFSHAHTFPQIERAILHDLNFGIPCVVDALIQMPRLTHLIATGNGPFLGGERLLRYINGLAIVVRQTSLRKVTVVLPEASYVPDREDFISLLRERLPDDRKGVEVVFLERPKYLAGGTVEDWIIIRSYYEWFHHWHGVVFQT
jgi:hypothetical protein